MNIPKNGRIVIIDNKISDAEPLIKELSKHGHPVTYFSGDLKELPEKPLEGIRLLFLDMILIDDEDVEGKEKTIVAMLKAVLKRVIGDNNGPIIPIAWTRNPTLVDPVEEYLHSRGFYFPMLRWEKKDFLKVGEGRYDIDLIYKKLKEGLKGRESLEIFMLWENLIHSASGNTIDEFSRFHSMNDNWNYKTASLFLKLAKSFAGNQINDSSITKITENSMFSLNSILGDQINKQVRDNVKNASPKIPFKKINQNIIQHEIDAKINSNLLIINDIDNSDLPGSIYKNLKIKKPQIKNIFKKIDSFLEKKELRKKTKPIFLEITPACDYAEEKRMVSRILPGFLWPKEFSKKIPKTAEYLYKSKEVFIDGSVYVMVFDFRYLTSIEIPKLPSKQVLFVLQSELLADIQSKLSNHVSRLGVATIDPIELFEKQITAEFEIPKSA